MSLSDEELLDYSPQEARELLEDEITLDWARDDHVQENLTGEGKDIEFIDNTE